MEYEIIQHSSPFEVFNKIFDSLIFYKTNPIQGNILTTYTTYAAKLQSFTSNSSRFVLLILRNEDAKYEKSTIHQLNWISLQTRTLSNEFTVGTKRDYLPIEGFDLKRLDTRYVEERGDSKIKLNLKSRDYNKTEYFVPLPIELELLHDVKKKSVYQYADTLELRQALSTFECVIKKL